MSTNHRYTPSFWRNLLWKTGLILLLLFLLAQITIIWLMGQQETEDAFSSGRRLLVTLDSSAVEGKIISSSPSEETSVKEPDVQENKPAEEPDRQLSPETPQTTVNTETKNIPPGQTSAEPEVENNVGIIKEETEEITPPALSPSKTPPAEFSARLAEKTEFGYLPKIAADGTKPWKYYAKQMTVKDKKPMIAIIVTGLGHNRNISEQALRLPEAINLSFSPYANDLDSWMVAARLSGHELLIDLPMESSNYPVSDPGPLGLLVSKEQQENETRIKKLMAHDFGYIGFLTPQDEAFLDNNELFKSLLNILSGRGLMLVVGRQPPKNDTKEMIEKGNTASIIVDTLVDEELTPTAIQARLSLLEQTARQRGYAVGVMGGYPISIKQLAEWSAKAEENGFNLVPISLIVSKRY